MSFVAFPCVASLTKAIPQLGRSVILYSAMKPSDLGIPRVFVDKLMVLDGGDMKLKECPFIALKDCRLEFIRPNEPMTTVGRWHQPTMSHTKIYNQDTNAPLLFGRQEAALSLLGSILLDAVAIQSDGMDAIHQGDPSIVSAISWKNNSTPNVSLRRSNSVKAVSPKLIITKAMGNVITGFPSVPDLMLNDQTFLLIQDKILTRISSGNPQDKGILVLEPSTLKLVPGMTIQFVEVTPLANSNIPEISPGINIFTKEYIDGMEKLDHLGEATDSDSIIVGCEDFIVKTSSLECKVSQDIAMTPHMTSAILSLS